VPCFIKCFFNIQEYSSRGQVKVKVTLRLTVSQSISLDADHHLGLMTRYLLLFDNYGLVLWGALSDERTVLSFVSQPAVLGQLSVCTIFAFYMCHMLLNTYAIYTKPTKLKVKVMLRPTVQSASLSWNKAPIWGLRPHLCYSQTVAGLLIWGALSDKRTGLPFARLSQQ
jgi:hypothetical protein